MPSQLNKILMVDDDAVIARVYGQLLERKGFEFHVVNDGALALGRLHELQPEAILLDIMLPKANGFELLRKIRAIEQFARTPIFMLTNAYMGAFVTKAEEEGATGIFNKSTTPPSHIVDRLLAAREAQNP